MNAAPSEEALENCTKRQLELAEHYSVAVLEKMHEDTTHDCALLLQCGLTGKVQGTNSWLSSADRGSYRKIKSALLKTHQLVSEAYRQRFRAWKRRNG